MHSRHSVLTSLLPTLFVGINALTLIACEPLQPLMVEKPRFSPDSVAQRLTAVTSTSPVTLLLADSSLNVGQQVQALAMLPLVNGVPNTTATVKWSSSSSLIATISSSGLVTARAAGAATITAAVTLSPTLPIVTNTVAMTVVNTTTPATPTPTPLPVSPTGPWNGTATIAELPRVTMNTTYPTIARQVRVAAGSNLQAAINAAVPGDELLLPPGATFIGNFVLPPKSGTGWIVIRTDVTDAALGVAGTRMSPSRASTLQLAKILTPTNQPALSTLLGAHHYRLTGLDVSTTGGRAVYHLVGFGDASTAQNTTANEAHDLVLDRSYVHGSPMQDLRRCVTLNSATSAVIDSWLGECHSNQGDSQAILGMNGEGPFTIQNNTLESGHQAFMFGGGDPVIPNLVPSDITIRGNHMTRPAAWKGVWQTKTIVETKNARRVLLEGNVIENVWADAQVGYAILLKSSNQDGTAPWSTTSDVTFRYNRIRNVGAVFNIAAHPEQYPVVPAARFAIYDNVTDAVNVGPYVGPGIGIQVLGDVADVIFAHNTTINPTGNSATMFDGYANTRLVMHSNVVSSGAYGVFGSGKGVGTAALAYYAPNGLFMANAIIGATCGQYPTGTSCPTLAGVGFVNASAGDYRLTLSSLFIGQGYDGRDLGADVNKVASATQGAVVAP